MASCLHWMHTSRVVGPPNSRATMIDHAPEDEKAAAARTQGCDLYVIRIFFFYNTTCQYLVYQWASFSCIVW
ncbi:unnamed protein product [Ectocarpus fasciculatus]